MGVQPLPYSQKTKEIARAGEYRGVPVSETITNGFFTVDHNWTVKYWNKAAEQLLKVTATQIVGKNIWEEFAAIIPVDFYTVYQKAFLLDIPLHFNEYWPEMGAWFDVITYYNDGVLSVSFKSSNLSGTLHPQLQLKTLNELYRFVTEVTNDCLWEMNIGNRELFWIDGGHKRVFGYAIENALLPQSFWESRLHPGDKDRVLTGLQATIAAGTEQVWEIEYRFKKANGDYAFVHDRAYIIYEHQKAVRMVGATQDITRRKFMEAALFETETRLSLIAKQTVNAVIITDAEEKITWVNEAFTHITGYSAEEAIGKKPGHFLQGKDTDPAAVGYLRQQIKDHLPFDCNIVNYTKLGKKYWMHVQGQAVPAEKGIGNRFFAIETDITEKVLLENKLKQEQVSKQKEITDAVLTAQENERSDIGKELHDNINQVLGAAKLYVEMARAEDNNKELYLTRASTHLVSVIEEIRSISKTLIPQSMSLVGLGESIDILLDDLARVHPLKIRFTEKDMNEITVNAKLQLNIYRIVQEQVNNILKHSGATRAKISLKRQANKIMLIITDNGRGCDLRLAWKGVGIRNIQSRAELFQGSMVVSSKPGKGYRLKVILPVG